MRSARAGFRSSTPVAVLLFIVGALAGVVMESSMATDFALVSGSVMVMALGVGQAIVLAPAEGVRAGLRRMHLGSYFGLSTATVFGFANFAYLLFPNQFSVLIEPGSVRAAIGVAALGSIALTAGYLALGRRIIGEASSAFARRLFGARPIRISQLTAWRLCILGLLADGVQIAIGRYGYSGNIQVTATSGNSFAQVLTIIAQAGTFGLAVSALDLSKNKSRGRLISLATLMLAELGLAFVSGLKEQVVVIMLAVLFGYAAGSGRLRPAALATLVAIFVFFVVPVITNARSLVNTGGGRRLSTLGAIEKIIGGNEWDLLASQPGQLNPLESSLSRISRVGDLAIILQKTPGEVAYRPISELIESPILGMVPRAVWPSKPVLDAGYQFSQEYYDIPSSVYTSNAVTPEGDLWRHGGLGVLLVGMALLGVFFRFVDTAVVFGTGLPQRLFLPLAFFGTVVKQEMDIVQFAAGVPSAFIAVWLGTRLAGFGKDSTRVRSSSIQRRPARSAVP